MYKYCIILNNEWNDKESNDVEEINDVKENYDFEGIENVVVYILVFFFWCSEFYRLLNRF